VENTANIVLYAFIKITFAQKN